VVGLYTDKHKELETIDELQSSVLFRVRFDFFARLQLGGVQVVIVNSSSPWLLQSTI